jgi:hypothetical protein
MPKLKSGITGGVLTTFWILKKLILARVQIIFHVSILSMSVSKTLSSINKKGYLVMMGEGR